LSDAIAGGNSLIRPRDCSCRAHAAFPGFRRVAWSSLNSQTLCGFIVQLPGRFQLLALLELSQGGRRLRTRNPVNRTAVEALFLQNLLSRADARFLGILLFSSRLFLSSLFPLRLLGGAPPAPAGSRLQAVMR
jgi:hypothetical protein